MKSMHLSSRSLAPTKEESSSPALPDEPRIATPKLPASKSQSSSSPKKNRKGDQVRWCVNQANDPSNDPVWQQVLAQTRQTTSISDSFQSVAGNGFYTDFQHNIGFNPHIMPNSNLNAENPEGLMTVDTGTAFAHPLDQPIASSMVAGTAYPESRRPEYLTHRFQHPPLIHGASVQPFSWGYVGDAHVGMVSDLIA